MSRGIFITFEGGEGAGKSTVVQKIAALLQKDGIETVLTREPGGCATAEKIRAVLLDGASEGMSAECEALLLAAARKENITKTISPALEQGKVVLCDRYLDSSLAYQGYAEGLGFDKILSYNAPLFLPQRTYWLDIDVDTGLARAKARGSLNRMDAKEKAFHEAIAAGYEKAWQRDPERIVRINASLNPDEIAEMIAGEIRELLHDQ